MNSGHPADRNANPRNGRLTDGNEQPFGLSTALDVSRAALSRAAISDPERSWLCAPPQTLLVLTAVLVNDAQESNEVDDRFLEMSNGSEG